MKGHFWRDVGRALSGHWGPAEIDVPSERVILAALNFYEFRAQPGPAEMKIETYHSLMQAVREYLESRDQL